MILPSHKRIGTSSPNVFKVGDNWWTTTVLSTTWNLNVLEEWRKPCRQADSAPAIYHWGFASRLKSRICSDICKEVSFSLCYYFFGPQFPVCTRIIIWHLQTFVYARLKGFPNCFKHTQVSLSCAEFRTWPVRVWFYSINTSAWFCCCFFFNHFMEICRKSLSACLTLCSPWTMLLHGIFRPFPLPGLSSQPRDWAQFSPMQAILYPIEVWLTYRAVQYCDTIWWVWR